MGWGCAQVYAGQEARAVLNLERQGFEALCPRYTRARLARDPLAPSYPLFPGYLFVRIDPDTLWGPIRSTYGVIRLLVSTAHEPLMVPDEFIASLGRLSETASTGWLAPGAVVRVRRRGSSVDEMLGTVVRMSGAQRVHVLMSLFNRDAVVEIAGSELEPA